MKTQLVMHHLVQLQLLLRSADSPIEIRCGVCGDLATVAAPQQKLEQVIWIYVRSHSCTQTEPNPTAPLPFTGQETP